MQDRDIIKHIKQILQQRGWSNYKLAHRSNLSTETINKMLRENHSPSLYTLIKICDGLDIPISQFFAEIEGLNDEYTQLLTDWDNLSPDDRYLVKVYMAGLLKTQAPIHKRR